MVCQCLPFLKKLRFKQTAIIPIFYEKFSFVGFGDWRLEFGTVPLSCVQLVGECGDVLVGVVDPRSMEAGLGLDLLSVVDDGPSLDVGEERVDGFVVVSDVFLPPLLNVLRINDLFDGGDSAGFDGILEVIFMP